MPFLTDIKKNRVFRNSNKWYLKQSYQYLEEQNNSILKNNFPSFLQYCSILKDYIKCIVFLILLKRYKFVLPFKLGEIGVKKVSSKYPKQYRLDYKAMYEHYKSTGERIKMYHTNEHSNFDVYRFYWQRSNLSIPNLKFYSFLPSIFNKSLLSFCIKELKIDYYE